MRLANSKSNNNAKLRADKYPHLTQKRTFNQTLLSKPTICFVQLSSPIIE